MGEIKYTSEEISNFAIAYENILGNLNYIESKFGSGKPFPSQEVGFFERDFKKMYANFPEVLGSENDCAKNIFSSVKNIETLTLAKINISEKFRKSFE